jgi:hypothetical protein
VFIDKLPSITGKHTEKQRKLQTLLCDRATLPAVLDARKQPEIERHSRKDTHAHHRHAWFGTFLSHATAGVRTTLWSTTNRAGQYPTHTYVRLLTRRLTSDQTPKNSNGSFHNQIAST